MPPDGVTHPYHSPILRTRTCIPFICFSCHVFTNRITFKVPKKLRETTDLPSLVLTPTPTAHDPATANVGQRRAIMLGPAILPRTALSASG